MCIYFVTNSLKSHNSSSIFPSDSTGFLGQAHSVTCREHSLPPPSRTCTDPCTEGPHLADPPSGLSRPSTFTQNDRKNYSLRPQSERAHPLVTDFNLVLTRPRAEADQCLSRTLAPTHSESAVTLLSAQSSRPTRPRVLGSQHSTRPCTERQQWFQARAAPRNCQPSTNKAFMMKHRQTQRWKVVYTINHLKSKTSNILGGCGLIHRLLLLQTCLSQRFK